MNDFTGFSFCGVHSSDLHIVRVSDGSRYNENLTPAFQDVTAQVPGRDGQYYWEAFDLNRPISIQFAFDKISETDKRALSQVFSSKNEGWLIFDELPFKKYWVKLQSPPQMKYICFDENNARVYKGEGTINFIAYDPYARSIKKYLDEFDDEDYPNKDEWAAASGMLSTKGTHDGTDSTAITVYNAGDKETDWMAFFSVTYFTTLTSITLTSGANTIGTMGFTSITAQGSDTYIRINSRTNLIEGCIKVNGVYKPTGTLYNKHLTSGDFFKIPTGGDYVFNSNVSCAGVEYNYLYY